MLVAGDSFEVTRGTARCASQKKTPTISRSFFFPNFFSRSLFLVTPSYELANYKRNERADKLLHSSLA